MLPVALASHRKQNLLFEPFSISCLTCSAQLKVRDASVIGQILACPKCHSMVLVEPPETLPAEGGGPSGTAESINPALEPSHTAPPTDSVIPTAAQPPPAPPVAAPPLPPDVAHVEASAAPVAATPFGHAAGATPLVEAAVPTLPTAPPPPWQRYLLLGTAGAIGVIVAVGAWMYWKSIGSATTTSTTAIATATNSAKRVTDDSPSNLSTADRSTLPAAPEEARLDERTAQVPEATASPAAAQESPDISSTNLPTSALAEDAAADPPATPAEPLPSAAASDTPAAPPGDTVDTTQQSADVVDEPATEHPLPGPNPDIASRLETPLDAIEFNETRLSNVVQLISQLTSVRIELDEVALARLGIAANRPVQIRQEKTTAVGLLDAVLNPYGLCYIASGDRLYVTTMPPAAAALTTVRYTVSDLARSQREMELMADLIRRFVAPQSWQSAGGSASLSIDGRVLVVGQIATAHRELLMFCEKLRVARGLAPRSRLDPQQFQLESRSAKAAAALDQPVRFNSDEQLALSDFVSRLSYRGQVRVVVDKLALMRSGISPSVPIRIDAAERRVADWLTTVLEPLGLSHQVVGPALVQITTPSAMRQWSEIEFYRVEGGAVALDEGNRLVQRIRHDVAGGSWSGDTPDAAIYFDPVSRCLIVRQSQSVQRAIETMLTGAAGGNGR